MTYKLTDAWRDGYSGPFERRDGSQVYIVSRMVEDGFTMYLASDGTKYHASGHPDSHDTDGLDIVNKYRAPINRTDRPKTKPKKVKPRLLDSRLTHLIKLQKEARQDVERYVKNKWTPGKNLNFTHQGVHCRAVVMHHDTVDGVVVVHDMKKQRKIRVPYVRIKDRRANAT